MMGAPGGLYCLYLETAKVSGNALPVFFLASVFCPGSKALYDKLEKIEPKNLFCQHLLIQGGLHHCIAYMA